MGDREKSRGRSHSRSRSRSKGHDKKDDKKSRSRSAKKDTKSRSRSAKKDTRSPSPVTRLKVTDADCAFVNGKMGKTKDRIAAVAGARIEIKEKDLEVEIRGPERARARAKKYCSYVIAQRSGPVTVTDADDDDDLSFIQIPQKAAGFVTGKQGVFLRMIETEWNTLMFFCDVDKTQKGTKEFEKLAIWGDLRGRRGSELKALNAVETMVPGYFEKVRDEVVGRDKGKGADGDWDTDTIKFEDSEVSYALGKQGNTRKKLEVASGAIVQYIGSTGLFSGPKPQRRRAKDYMKFLFGQLEGPVYVDGWEDRGDCCVLKVPQDIVPYITGSRRAALSSVEDKYGTLMFFMNKKNGMQPDTDRPEEQLIIFGAERGRCGAEIKIRHEIEWKKPKTYPDIKEFTSDKDGFDTDIMKVSSEDINYLIGKKGSTADKIETAVGCFLIYVGNFAHIGGSKSERTRCREYLNWLLQQLKGPVTVADIKSRSDCMEVWVPQKCKGIVMGNRGMELRRVEQETGVFSFMALNDKGEERLIIFGKDLGTKFSPKGRMAAEKMIKDIISDVERGGYRGGDRRGGGGNDRRDRRDRSDSRKNRRRSPSGRRQRSDSRRGRRERTPPRRRSPPPRRNDSRDKKAPPRRDDSRDKKQTSKRDDSRGGGRKQDDRKGGSRSNSRVNFGKW